MLSDQGTAENVRSNSLKTKIASDKIYHVSGSKIAILNAGGRR